VALEEHTLVTIERVRDERLAAAPAVEGRLAVKADGLDVGEHLTVRLVSADVAVGHLDFERVTS
jgi:hypothetical protein